MENKPVVLAVSGVKNSGKTTLIEQVIPKLKAHGLRIAVIKHDGHEFEPDVPGTDSHRFRAAGADGTAVFSQGRWMMVKEQEQINAEALISYFQDADLILIEGLKHQHWPKLELVRAGNSDHPVCDPETVIAYVSDIDLAGTEKAVIALDDIEAVAVCITEYYLRESKRIN